MNWTDLFTEITRFMQVYYTLVSIIGICVNIWAAFDSLQDLKRLRFAKINSLVERTGRIAFRDVISIVATHIVFFSLGLLSLTAPVRINPDLARAVLILLFIFLVSGVQTFIVVAQTMNQYERIIIRNTLIQEARESRETVNAEG